MERNQRQKNIQGVKVFETTTRLLDTTLESSCPIIVHQGGTSSSKTWSILQAFFIKLFQYPGSVATIVGQDIPNLRVGAYRDAQTLINRSSIISGEIISHNKVDRILKFRNRSMMEFNSYDNAQDAKSGKRDFLFVNEANGIPYSIFEELNMRTSRQTMIDFNPTSEFWAHEKLKKKGVLWIYSTFRNNPFIQLSVKEKILGYKDTDPYRWLVYGLGQVGRLEGLVFENFKETTEWPKEYKWKLYWLDWGFSNSPTSFGEIRFVHGEIFVKELIYEIGLTNQDICAKLKELEINKADEIIADSAEPKSIEEIYRGGFNIKPSTKGTDSVRAGIDKLREYKINIYRSPNTMAEFSNYVWKVDKNGKSLNIPIDAWNHSIDGIRGVLFTFLDFIPELFPEQNKGIDNPELERKAKPSSAGFMDREW